MVFRVFIGRKPLWAPPMFMKLKSNILIFSCFWSLDKLVEFETSIQLAQMCKTGTTRVVKQGQPNTQLLLRRQGRFNADFATLKRETQFCLQTSILFPLNPKFSFHRSVQKWKIKWNIPYSALGWKGSKSLSLMEQNTHKEVFYLVLLPVLVSTHKLKTE